MGKRVKLLEEIKAIKKMKPETLIAFGEQHRDDALCCFPPIPGVNLGTFEKFAPWEAVEKFFKEFRLIMTRFIIHRLECPIIEVNGDRAKRIRPS